MTRDAKNREKDQKIYKLMKNNDFFRFFELPRYDSDRSSQPQWRRK
ncbi:hypothetical protein C8J30_1232 [Rhodobacter viridis]|uniref:Uncharacterized protein n=1 Tax=Rhodobacter viridis TaxID=1054202 RepID=A0A318TS43_9RHOB|nr:hypothetical protein C8J30_1232 [Rhodobacter viridis]